MAKTTLANAGLKDYLLFELDNREDGDEIMDALLKITGGRTVSIKVYALVVLNTDSI